MLAESWPALLVGWPAMLLVMLATVAGFASRRALAVMVGAILLVPIAVYLGGTPRFQLVGPALPLLHLAAAWAARRDRWVLASLLLVPFAVVVVILARAVLAQGA